MHDGDQRLTRVRGQSRHRAARARGGAARLGTPEVAEHLVLADDDPAAANTADRPDRVGPRNADGARVTDGALHATLPPRSWNVLRLARAA